MDQEPADLVYLRRLPREAEALAVELGVIVAWATFIRNVDEGPRVLSVPHVRGRFRVAPRPTREVEPQLVPFDWSAARRIHVPDYESFVAGDHAEAFQIGRDVVTGE